MSRNITELDKLEEYLKANGFVYQREDRNNLYSAEEWRKLVDKYGARVEPMDIHQIVVFDNECRSWDVICQRGSFGCNEGLLEGMGDIFEGHVEGYLSAQDVIKRIEEAK